MEKETTLKAALATTPAPEGLYDLVMAKVSAARIRAARIRAALAALVAAVSFGALVPMVEYTADQLYKSGFYDYASLIISDRADAALYWRELSLTLLESLPSVALLVLIPIAAALLWSLMRLIKNARAGFIRYA